MSPDGEAVPVGLAAGVEVLAWAAARVVVTRARAGAAAAAFEDAEADARLADEAAGLAVDADGLAEDTAGLADEVAGLATEPAGLAGATAALASGLGLAEAAGAAARVSRIADVTAVVPAAEPAWPVPAAAPAGAEEGGLLATGSAQGMTAGPAVVREAFGNSIPAILMATTETPANTLAAGAPAVRILMPPALRRAARQAWLSPAHGQSLRCRHPPGNRPIG